MEPTPIPRSDTSPVRRLGLATPRIARAPAPELRMRLRTKLVFAMIFAALVPAGIVALLATRVILSSLEVGVRDDADRQLTVTLNLVLRAVERLGDETVQLSESGDLAAAFDPGVDRRAALETWFAKEAAHVPSAKLQLFDAGGTLVLERTIGDSDARFAGIAVSSSDPIVADGLSWTRGVSLEAIDDRVVMRAVSPVVDHSLTLRGVLVLSTPLDGDFADGIKGALSADVLIGGPKGRLQGTFRSTLGRRADPIELSRDDRAAALHSRRVIRDLDHPTAVDAGNDRPGGRFKIAVTALLDRKDRPIGIVGVAVDREPLEATKALALRTLVGGGIGAIAFALVLALFWSRRLGAPIARLHRGAIAVSRGDLDHRIDIAGGDELTDLATAFNQMTSTLKDNQARLAARMREIVALHDAGRAVSSVIDLDSVSRKIVDAVARTFDVQLAALWLADDVAAGASARAPLRASAARAKRSDVSTSLATDEALAAADALRPIAEDVRTGLKPLRLERAVADPTYGEAARRAGAPGPLVALPLDRADRTRHGAKSRVVGVLAVGRAEASREFSEADLNLLTTFADQAGAAVENALLYQQVRQASEELEKKVRLRTAELTAINSELGRALADLRDTQAQLVLSERMAGLGLLVAGVAHEINSPTAAIRGSIDGLPGALARVARHGTELAMHAGSPATALAIANLLEQLAPPLAERSLPTSLAARKAARELVGVLEAARIADAQTLAAELADLGATVDDAEKLVGVLAAWPGAADAREVVAALTDHVYLHRTASTVRHAVAQIQRIVGALKSYSHLDQQPTRTEADLHEGLETTLALLHHALRDIVVERHYGNLPRVPVYVDELNQVWTNLISNAQQALGGKGTIAIETAHEGDSAVVRVIDDGPGVPEEALPRIFEAFYTTKPKGEGTGLGLGIARKIVEKHGGQLRCESRPGRTVFEVRLPIHAKGAA
ncbi:MAG TPA: ATP-binding protein [Kofleriaceae bacterium]|nr:ATP-binding protein [Kofleriaceae bacterium]